MVSGDRVTQLGQHTGGRDIGDRVWLTRHVRKVGWVADIGGAFVPVKDIARRGGQILPGLVTGKDISVALDEHFGRDGSIDNGLDLGSTGPDITQIDVL